MTRLILRSVFLICSTLPLVAQSQVSHPFGSKFVTPNETLAAPVGQPKAARGLGSPAIPLRLRMEEFNRQRAEMAERFLRQGISRSASGMYSFADLNQLSYADLVSTLVSIQYYQIKDLFQFNPDTKAFFLDTNRVQYLIDALQSRASTFTAADEQGIETLVEVVRSGFYLAFYYGDLASLNTLSYKDKCLPAIRAAQANPNFSLGTSVQDLVVMEFGLLVADADSDPGTVNGFTPILKSFNDNWAAYNPYYSKKSAVYYVLSGIDYDLTWDVLQGYPYSPTRAGPFHHAIDGYLNEVARLATSFNDNDPNSNWIIHAAVYAAGYDGRFHTVGNFGLITMTTVIQKYGRTPWVYSSAQAAEIIHFVYNDIDANGNVLDWSQVQKDIRAQYTPIQKDYDCGLFHTQVGDKVNPGKIQTLIWAHKETKAQFFRALGSDAPIDPSHHQDDSLTIVVYNSPDDYQMNRFANELPTSNGGIYIENMGTFFTYERTPADSIYSLEELFRHEGVHYLQGRYEEPGLFGDSPLYDNDRLTWMDEGSAEFFAGSTRSAGVKTRSIKAELIAGYDPSTWYSIFDVVYATYASGFTFYDYADAFVDYLYRNQWDNYLEMLDRLKANDGNGFSNIAAQDAADGAMNTGYRNFLQYMKDNAGTFPSPSTSPNYLSTPPIKPSADVYADIQSLTGLTNIKTAICMNVDWDTFTLRGIYAAGPSAGSRLADWHAMDTTVNNWLTALAANPWPGHQTDTAYFVNYQKDSWNQVSWEVVFHGVLNSGRQTTPILTTSGNPGYVGTPVVFTAVVAPVSGRSPTGGITFWDGTTSLGTAAISGGTASITTSALIAGAHSISAVYAGDINFNSNTSQPIAQLMNNPADTATSASATATPNPALFRKTLTFSVAVTSNAGTPGGNVIFMDGPATLGSATLNEMGQATINLSQLALGRHQIVGMYTGGSGFQGSIAPPVIIYRSPRPR